MRLALSAICWFLSILALCVSVAGCRSVARYASSPNASVPALPEPRAASTPLPAKPLPNGSSESASARTSAQKVLASEEGLASYYAAEFHGRRTSSGEIFDVNALTAAHLNLPFGTTVRVTNLANNKSVVVRINDRLPPNNKGRIIDLSPAAARQIEMIQAGVVKVRVETLSN